MFKRNQVEEAILRTLDAKNVQIADLRVKMKRLLLTDRRIGRSKQSDPKADRRFAFYSHKPQGSGIEVMFTGYEAFALMAALFVLTHGIPQAKVVRILQQVRSDFEAVHRETLLKDPKGLFDPEAVRAMARPGMIAVDNAAPVFLAFVSLDTGKGRVRATISVCQGLDGLGRFFKEHSVPGAGTTFFEFTGLIHRLAANLSQTRPVKRGRSMV
jgi:hypothetical protein